MHGDVIQPRRRIPRTQERSGRLPSFISRAAEADTRPVYFRFGGSAVAAPRYRAADMISGRVN